MSEISIRTDLRPGDLGRVIAFHGLGYTAHDGHFGLDFEAYVARTIADYWLDNGGRGRIFLAERDGALVGCAAMIDRSDLEDALGQLRWVLVSPSERGSGLGRRLINAALDQARVNGWRSVFLETTEGLDASMAIYRSMGFEVVSNKNMDLWSGPAPMIVMRLSF